MKYYCSPKDVSEAMEEQLWTYNRTKAVAQRRAKAKKRDHRKARRVAKGYIEIE